MTPAYPASAWTDAIDLAVAPGTVLVAGAGDGIIPAWAVAGGAGRVMVVDPDPARLAELAARFGDGLRTVEAALSDASGRADYRRHNLAALSGATAPLPALRRLFPGLRETESFEVATLTLGEVTAMLDPDPSGHNLLVIDMPGAETGIVGDLLAHERPDLWEHVILRAGIEPFFEGAEPLAALIERLEAADFRLRSVDRSDPDFPVAHLGIDRVARRLRDGEAAIAGLRAELAQLGAERDRLAETLAARAQELDTLATERDAACRELAAQTQAHPKEIDALKADIARIAAERDAARRDLEAAAQAHPKETGALKAEIAASREAQKTLRARLDQQARDAASLHAASVRLSEELHSEREKRQKLETGFARAEAQVDLLREILAIKGDVL